MIEVEVEGGQGKDQNSGESKAIPAETIMKALEESEERIRTMYENIPGGLIIIDGNYIIRDVNNFTCEVTGYKREELIGKLCDILCPKGSLSRKCPIWEEKKESFKGMDTTIKCKNGYRNPILKNAKKIFLDGEVCILENFQDIDELKAIQKKLDEEKRSANLYLDLLGHDIGNLHQGILNSLQLAREKCGAEPTTRYLLGHGLELTHSSINLVNNVVILSKLKDTLPVTKVIDLDPILGNTTEALKKMYPFKNIDLEMDLRSGNGIIAEPLIERAIFNLLQNSVKYQIGKEVKVKVSTRMERCDEKDLVVIEICDHGPGISDGEKETVFERRDRANRPQTGLGLSLVKMIVERSGGEISVRDRLEGDTSSGCCFDIRIPSA